MQKITIRGEVIQEREGDKRCIIHLVPIGANGAQSHKETMKWYKTLESNSFLHLPLNSPREVSEGAGTFTHQLRPIPVSGWC